MMKNIDNIDDKRFEFRDEYWDEAKLLLQKEKKKRRAVIWWNFFGFSLFALGLTTLLFWNSKEEELSIQAKKQTLPLSEVNKVADVAVFENEKKLIVENISNSIESKIKAEESIISKENNLQSIDSIEKEKLPLKEIAEISVVAKAVNFPSLDIVGKAVSKKAKSFVSRKFGMEVGAGFNQVNGGQQGWQFGMDFSYNINPSLRLGVGVGANYYSSLYSQRFEKIYYNSLETNLYQVNNNGTLPTDVMVAGGNYFVLGGNFYAGTILVQYRQGVEISNLFSFNLSLPFYVDYAWKRHSLKVKGGVEYMLMNSIRYQEKHNILGEELATIDEVRYNSFKGIHRSNVVAELSYAYAMNERVKIQFAGKMLMNYKIHNPIILSTSLVYKLF